MQDFSLTTGKTLTELTALTQDTVCGDFNYNAENHLLYEKEWHSIDPNGVIKPSDTQHYFYKDQQLKTDPKYCGKLYWKMCAQVWTSDIGSANIIANNAQSNNNSKSAVFNSSNTALSLVLRSVMIQGDTAQPQKTYFLSKKVDNILGTNDIKKNFGLIKGLQTAWPSQSYKYIYSTLSQSSDEAKFFLYDDGFNYNHPSITFGQPTGTKEKGLTELISTAGGDDSTITIGYSQPENNTDSANFYNMPSEISSNNIPQALPLGIGIYTATCYKDGITTSTSSKIIPFMCFCIGITETPTEA